MRQRAGRAEVRCRGVGGALRLRRSDSNWEIETVSDWITRCAPAGLNPPDIGVPLAQCPPVIRDSAERVTGMSSEVEPTDDLLYDRHLKALKREDDRNA